MNRYIREYESKNKAFGHEIDRIFLQVKHEEQACASVEQQIESVYESNQAKINAMDSGKLQRYQELVQTSMQLQERCVLPPLLWDWPFGLPGLRSCVPQHHRGGLFVEIRYQQQVGQVDAIGDQIAMLQAQRDANTFNHDYRQLEMSAVKLHKQMQGLAEELEISKLEPDEMQKRVLAKVRADNAAAQQVDDSVRQIKEETRRAEQTSAELTADLAERNSGGSSEKDKVRWFIGPLRKQAASAP